MRVAGWESLLNEHIANASRTPFAWGRQDCALWCADWVMQAIGVDFAADWRGKYKTEAGAAKIIRKSGFKDLAAVADDCLEPVMVQLAQRGDLVMNADACLGICNGVRSFFLTADDVTGVPTKNCRKAWAVR